MKFLLLYTFMVINIMHFSRIKTDSINRRTIIPVIYGSSHVYLNTTSTNQITIACKPSFYVKHQQSVSLYKILFSDNNPTEEILTGDSKEFGSITYDNKTGYNFSRPQWSVNNTRLLCLINDLHESSEGLVVGNSSQYIKYYINVTDIEFGIKDVKVADITPNNQYSIDKNYGNLDTVQLNATIVEPSINYVDITWTKNDSDFFIEINSNKKSIQFGNKFSLEISDYDLSDSGVYTLTARTMRSFISVSWTLIISAPAKTELILSETQVVFSKGLNYTIKCSARLTRVASLPNMTWYSAPCIDPINTDCMGEQFVPNSNQIQTNNNVIKRINGSKLYEISSSINVCASNTTYQCIIDQLWSADKDESDKQVQQKLMLALDVPESALNGSSFAKEPVQLTSKRDGNTLELNCRVNIGVYANDISFYYYGYQIEQWVMISQTNTSDSLNIKGGYFEKRVTKYNPTPGVFACKYRERGSKHHNQTFYTFNSSQTIMLMNTLLILCLIINVNVI